jgi:hypothetical protein
MCHGCFWYLFGGASVPRKKRLSTKCTEKVSLPRHYSVKCAQFSAPVLAFLKWNHCLLVLHLPSFRKAGSERMAFSFSVSQIMLHYTMVCLSVCLFHAKSLSVPHISDSNHQELLKMIPTTKDMTVTLISGLEGTKRIKFATRTSTTCNQLTFRTFQVQHNKLNRRLDLVLLTNKRV